ncbi:hypothetical protein LJR219_005023 [Phenylobacterium sp. LjRoot219]|uniref:hypothetical protein n=1 Tax=Phenylobacterium sp. LjRoot219 TaxID=3342283 RepID=UPI003ECE3F7D
MVAIAPVHFWAMRRPPVKLCAAIRRRIAPVQFGSAPLGGEPRIVVRFLLGKAARAAAAQGRSMIASNPANRPQEVRSETRLARRIAILLGSQR